MDSYGAGKPGALTIFPRGGRYADIQHNVVGDGDPRLFRTEHYGHFSYAVPFSQELIRPRFTLPRPTLGRTIREAAAWGAASLTFL